MESFRLADNPDIKGISLISSSNLARRIATNKLKLKE